jgi:pyruvate/2-oxoglutarate/acetoin dehydrogenase E1 component
MAVITYRDALNQALREEMQRDDRVFIMGEEVGIYQGAYKVSKGLLQEFGEMRVVDTPITELGFAGVGVGAAMVGLRPVIEFMTWNFALLALDQVVNSAAKMLSMSGGQFNIPIVFRGPNGAALQLSAQHSQAWESWLAHIPGLKVVAPGTPYDAKGLLKAAIRDPDPVLFFEHKRMYRLFRQEVPDDDYTVPIGTVRVAREGRDLTTIAYGLMLHYTLEAAAAVAGEGIEVEVLDLRTLVPLDKAAILASVEKTSKVLIVHEDTRTGGFGAELAATIAEEAFEFLDGPIRRLTGPDVPAMPFSTALEDAFMLDPAKIAQAMRDLAAY